jgi:hypothetical protein
MQGLLAEVNARVRDIAERQSQGAEEWEFRCECGARGCCETVSMSLAEYEAARAASQAILAEGHAQERPAAARMRAAGLREESAAVLEQAQLQGERARRVRKR